MTKVTLKMRLPSATLFAPIELPTRLQIPSWNPTGAMKSVAAIFYAIVFAASCATPK
jgi:hypothetical protein